MKSVENKNLIFSSDSLQVLNQLKDYSLSAAYTYCNFVGISVSIVNMSMPKEIIVLKADFLTSGLATITVNEMKESIPLRAQKHNGFEFIFVANGSYTNVVENHAYRLEEFDAILMNPNCKNMMTECDNLIAIILSLPREYLTQNHLLKHLTLLSPQSRFDTEYKNAEYVVFHALDINGSDSDSLPHRRKDIVKRLLYQLHEELSKKMAGYESIIAGLLQRLFDCLTDKNLYCVEHRREKYQGDKELAEQIKLYLDNRPQKITIADLSQVFHYNRNHLSKVFAEAFSRTIKEYNNAICMAEARRLLTETPLSITAIAEWLGFQSRSQFYQVFRQYYGCMPKELRQA